MDWRAPQAKAVSYSPAVAIAAAPADRAVPRVPAPAMQPEAPVPPKVNARDKAAPLTLDSSTIDRLADSVMQRIDRRVRIERERRGL